MATHLVQPPQLPLETVMASLKGVRKSLRGWVACCPAHVDREPSLSFGLGREGQVLLKCFAGCSLERIVEAMALGLADLFPNAPSSSASQTGYARLKACALLDLAGDKMLPWQYLFNLGVTEDTTGNLQILYSFPDGTPAPRHRLRTALSAREGSRWSKGEGKIVAYGLERLEEARKVGYLVIVEGESDCWTLWYHHFPAIGLPGAEMVGKLEEDYLTGIDRLFVMREPDAAGAKFVKNIELRLEGWKWPGKAYVVSLPDAKDPNDLHKQDMRGFKAAFQGALDSAEPLFFTRIQTASPASERVPSPFTLQELLSRELPPLRWAIPDILPEGLTLLAGKPKLGKSWLALSMALAVAAGGVALGKQPVTRGGVLYLALEDNERRLQSRARQLLASMTSVPSGIEFALSWPRLDQGGLMHLEEYLQAHPEVRMVIVDTWARVSPQSQSRQRSQYESDYAALTPLKYLADTYRISILAVHHLRKMGAADVLDEITGSIGVAGAADGALILKRERGRGEATLFVTGRDIEQEQQLALAFDSLTAMWTLVGNAEEFKRTRERQEIIDLLTRQLPEGMSPRQIAEALTKNYHTTRSLLRKMEDAGEVRHTNQHYFAIPDDTSCNQCNQSPPLQQPEYVAQVKGRSSSSIDYVDYTDYADVSDDPVASAKSSIHDPPSPLVDSSLQDASRPAHVLTETKDVQPHEHHTDVAAISVINRNQCNQRNQSEVSSPLEIHPLEAVESDIALDAKDVCSEIERTRIPIVSKSRCPRHPKSQWVRFDPSGQAWCDNLGCWDCYRLMKLGETLSYQPLWSPSSTTAIIDQGIEAWATFVVSLGSFAIVMATQQAIALCEASGVEVPNLSGEVQRLVRVW